MTLVLRSLLLLRLVRLLLLLMGWLAKYWLHRMNLSRKGGVRKKVQVASRPHTSRLRIMRGSVLAWRTYVILVMLLLQWLALKCRGVRVRMRVLMMHRSLRRNLGLLAAGSNDTQRHSIAITVRDWGLMRMT